jgi:tetratricopeptide (TPR) repeat protein
MYLKGSKWSMNRRRTRPNWFRIILLSLLVLGGAYVDRFIVPNQQPLGVPTATATRPPESYITEAEDLFNHGKLLQAVEAYQQAIAVSPDNPSVYIALARVQVFAGQYKDAQTSAENALLLNNNNSMAHAVRAWTLDFQGKNLEAKDAIQTALTIDDKNARAHAYYVEILVDSGAFEDLDKAVEASRVAQALAPDTLETHRARGIILEATQNYEEAVREFQEAIKINPNISDLHLRLGLNYLNLGIGEQAVAEFTRANALSPSDPLPDYYTSRTFLNTGEFVKALQYAETAVTDSPENPRYRGNLGVMYYHNLYWADAVKQLSLVVNGGLTDDGQRIEAINLIPNNARIAEYYYTYGFALARLNRCGEALQIAQQIQARVPADETAVGNAIEIINLCQQNLITTPIPLPTPTQVDSVSTEIPTPTPTP